MLYQLSYASPELPKDSPAQTNTLRPQFLERSFNFTIARTPAEPPQQSTTARQTARCGGQNQGNGYGTTCGLPGASPPQSELTKWESITLSRMA